MSGQQTNNVETAEQVLATLEQKRRDLIASRSTADARRREIAFAAHASDDRAAKQELDRLATAEVRFNSELRSIDDAITEARTRVQQAQAAQALAVDHANARAVRAVIGELREAGAVLDDCLHDLVVSGDALKAAFDKLAQLGQHNPRHEQLAALGSLAILTALGQTPWKRSFEVLQPRQRKNFAEVIRGWCKNLERNVALRLGEQPNSEGDEVQTSDEKAA